METAPVPIGKDREEEDAHLMAQQDARECLMQEERTAGGKKAEARPRATRDITKCPLVSRVRNIQDFTSI